MAVINRQVCEEYTEIHCVGCEVRFYVLDTWEMRLRSEGDVFYCPKGGHTLRFQGESSAQKAARLERELESAKASRRFAETILANERIANSKKLKRIEKRAAAGTCPCCHRTVSQMASHMKTKHPEFGKGSK